jgi:hypothetical protein
MIITITIEDDVFEDAIKEGVAAAVESEVRDFAAHVLTGEMATDLKATMRSALELSNETVLEMLIRAMREVIADRVRYIERVIDAEGKP